MLILYKELNIKVKSSPEKTKQWNISICNFLCLEQWFIFIYTINGLCRVYDAVTE